MSGSPTKAIKRIKLRGLCTVKSIWILRHSGGQGALSRTITSKHFGTKYDSVMALANLLIIEDDNLLRASISQSLKSLNFRIVAEAANAKSVFARIENKDIDVALIDIDLGVGANGIDIAKKLRSLNPRIGIIFLTTFSDPRLAKVRAEDLPVGSIYMQKTNVADLKQIANAIILAKQHPTKQIESKRRRIDLTDQQLVILQMVASGKTTSSIALELELSERAIEKTMTRLQKILNVENSKERNSRILLTNAYWKIIGKQ